MRTEVGLARLAIGVVALHVVDDNFLQPNPGTSAADHLVSGLVPLSLLVAAGALYGRLRAGARAVTALLAGVFGVLAGTEALHYAREVGPSGDDYTGLLSLVAGLVLLGVAGVTLWRSRRRDDRVWWRYSRRALLVVAAALVTSVVLFPVAIGYIATHASHGDVPQADLGTPVEDVTLTTSDGLRLNGWYVPSRNGAAVISFPGRQPSAQGRARFLVRHGYGVLLVDRRGEGESEGDPNLFGWEGDRDILAAVAFLQGRPDVDPQRIGGIGLSVGGEMMIAAAARSTALKAIVSEGASARSVRDVVANPGTTWQDVLGNGVATAATALFSNSPPPEDLKSLVPRISGAALFVYGQRGQPAEKPANETFYAVAHSPKELWEVPGAGHVGGLDARPREYERRVVGFFDRTLLGDTRR
ncbi:MAG TPA: CocE/NonD family hydrolase [Gaiella sp.]|nr:CocE/NonD family hydrolase [Gaiella sp.]